MNWLAVGLGTIAFFAVGALWYGVLFGRRWRAELGIEGPPSAMAMVLTLLAEAVVVTMLAHLIARTGPTPHVKLMMAFGFGATIMTPAVAINYLYQRRSLVLFLIDAGHFIVGMMAVGAVFVALG